MAAHHARHNRMPLAHGRHRIPRRCSGTGSAQRARNSARAGTSLCLRSGTALLAQRGVAGTAANWAGGLAQARVGGLAQRSWHRRHSRKPWLSSANALRTPPGFWHKDLWHSVPDRGSALRRGSPAQHRPAQHRPAQHRDRPDVWHGGSGTTDRRHKAIAASVWRRARLCRPMNRSAPRGVGISRGSVRVAGSVTRRAVRRPLGERRSPIDVRERTGNTRAASAADGRVVLFGLVSAIVPGGDGPGAPHAAGVGGAVTGTE